jgi:hypothetical protein
MFASHSATVIPAFVVISLRALADVMKYYEVPLIDATHACSPIFDKNVLLNLVVSPAKCDSHCSRFVVGDFAE